jgi:cytochrome b subunit of formate dehydrogenase
MQVVRYSRPTRWFHAGVYSLTFLLLATGAWLLFGREGDPSLLSRLFSTPDVTLHKNVGWALAGLGALGLFVGARGARDFVVRSLSFSRPEVSWFAAWPRAVFTGRFQWHAGHFDPGQRIANLVLAAGLIVLTASGIGLVTVHGGSAFVWLSRIHRWATYVVAPVIAGHVVVASGVLPGYRGVWRSMHGGRGLDEWVARRLWPEWTRKEISGPEATSPRPSRQRD